MDADGDRGRPVRRALRGHGCADGAARRGCDDSSGSRHDDDRSADRPPVPSVRRMVPGVGGLQRRPFCRGTRLGCQRSSVHRLLPSVGHAARRPCRSLGRRPRRSTRAGQPQYDHATAARRSPGGQHDHNGVDRGLEGRTAEALALYREALAGWRSLGLAWDEALTVIDMVKFLGPTEPEVQTAAESALAALRRLGAKPYIDRLEEAMKAPAAAGERAASTRSEAKASVS